MATRLFLGATLTALLLVSGSLAGGLMQAQSDAGSALAAAPPSPPPIPRGILSGDSAFVDWVRTYSGTDTIALVADVATDKDGGVFVTGLNWSAAKGDVGVTFKYDAAGTEKFQRIYESRTQAWNKQDDPISLAVDPLGRADMLVRSNIGGAQGWGLTFVQYDNVHPRSWIRRWDSEDYADELAISMAIDAVGSLYGVGYRNRLGWVTDLVAVKYSNRGRLEWGVTLTDSLWGSFPAKVVVTPDGSRTYIGGYRWSEHERNALVLALDFAGNLLWTVNWNGATNLDDRILDICLDPSGNIIAVGATKMTGTFEHDDYLILKISPSGSLLWQRQVGFVEERRDEATSVVTDASGNIFVVGSGDTQAGGTSAQVISYSPSGQERWRTEYAPGLSWTFARPCGAETDPDGNLFVAGGANYNDQQALFAIKLGLAGELVWEAFHTSSEQRPIYATAMTADRFGGVLLVGQEDYEPWSYVNKRAYVTVRFAQAMKAPKIANREVPTSLSSNYPNPFNPSTTISYQVPAAARVTLRVYDILGRELRSLVNNFQEAGEYRVDWDGRDADLQPVATGVYFYRLSVGEQSESRKMLLLK